MQIPATEIEQALRAHLGPTIRRDRWRRLGAAWAAVVATATLAAFALRAVEDRWGLDARWTWMLLAGGVVLALEVLRRRTRENLPDPRDIAREIERVHPDLAALLLTAVAQMPAQPGGRLGYLQEQLVREAVAKATPLRWSKAVPTSHLTAVALGFATGAAAFLFVSLPSLFPSLPPLLPDDYGIVVSPGHTQVERGTPVLVLARFHKALPSRVTLVVRVPGSPVQRFDMNKNLEDPVFGAVTSPVNSDRIDYQIEYAGRRTARFAITAYDHPDLLSIDARIEYPGQSEIAAKDIKDTRGLAVVDGAQVTLTFHLNKQVRDGQLRPEDGAPLPLRPAGAAGADYVVVLSPHKSQRYELRLTDPQGRANKAPPWLLIDVHRNLPAQVSITFPGRDVRVSPLQEVTLEAKASDDVGLLAYGVTYSLMGKPEKSLRLGGPVPGANQHDIRYELPLETQGARPDDLLTYYYWADDLGPDGKPRRSRSDMYFAEVRPFEEIFREGAPPGGEPPPGGVEPAADPMVQKQKDVINATWKLDREALDGRAADDMRDDIGVVKKAQAEVQKAAEEARDEARSERARTALGLAVAAMDAAVGGLAKAEKETPLRELPPALDNERAAFAALLRLRAREHEVTRVARGKGGGASRNQDGLSDLELKQEESRYETRREAAGEPDSAKAEDRQVLNRLRELARRQKTISERLKELQAALAEAKKPADKTEAEARLKKLREEQREALADMDELLQRMDSPENRSRMAEARAELERTRGRAQEASEAMARGETARAVGASTRAERELDKVRENLQRKVASAFEQEMRGLRDEAARIDEQQKRLGTSLQQAAAEAEAARAGQGKPGAAPPVAPDGRALAQRLEEQKKGVAQLLEQMRKVTEAAEGPSPLLSRKLYDSIRKARTDNVENALDVTGQLLDRNLLPDAQKVEAHARQGVAELRKGVDEAAKGLVGDEAGALRLARSELARLISEARREASSAAGGAPQGGAATQPGQAPGLVQAPGQPSGQQPGGDGQQPGAQPGNGQRGGGGQQPGGNGQRGGQGMAQGQGGGQGGPGGPGGGNAGPFTGEDFRGWSDRLRDVEELVPSAGLRQDVARVRDRARSVRADFKRHGEAPKWSVLEQQIMVPLTEIYDRVAEELRRIEPEHKVVPLDRDPVPSRYSDLVRRYYKSLAEGK